MWVNFTCAQSYDRSKSAYYWKHTDVMALINLVSIGPSHCPRARRLNDLIEPLSRGELATIETQVDVRSSTIADRIINVLLLLLGFHAAYLARKNQQLPELQSSEYIVCHDILLLPWVLETGSEVIFDAREFYPAQFEQEKLWRLTWGRLYRHICTKYLDECRSVVTVSDGLAELYRTRFGTHAKVIPSFAHPSVKAEVRTETPLRFVHHGNASAARSLENLVKGIGQVRGATLDLYLVVKEPTYYRTLEKLCDSYEHVNLHQPVSFEDIGETLSQYDVGIFAPEPKTTNLLYCLPNKFFEFIQAGLAVLISPLPDLQRWTVQHDVGWVTGGFSSEDIYKPAEQLGRETVEEKKANARSAADLCSSSLFATSFIELIQA